MNVSDPVRADAASRGRPAPAPLRRQPVDLVFLAFYAVNLLVVTYMIDLEQLVVPPQTNLAHLVYRTPAWPPGPVIHAVHWWGTHFDPLLMARPPFWLMTIWIDVLYFGPFYAFAIYAFVRGRAWIRVPALVWAGMMSANVLILMMEERFGTYASPHLPIVLAANAPWLLLALATIWRLRRDDPFAARGRTVAGDAAPADAGTAPANPAAASGTAPA